jgi:predicted secreted protein
MAANTGFIQGQDYVLSIMVSTTWTPVAHSTSHTLEQTLETRDRSSKDTGSWKGKVAGLLGWRATSESLALYDGYSFNDLKTKMDARTKVQVKMSGRAASGGGDDLYTAQAVGDDYYEGYGYITSLSLNAGNAADATCSCTIEGDGELESKVVAAPGP